MLFNTVTYLAFLFCVVVLYWVLPRRPRLALLFVSSLVFYGFWRFAFIPLMLLSVVIDYAVSLRMPGRPQHQKKRLLLVSLIANFGLLFIFKYLLFFQENVLSLSAMLGFHLDPVFSNIILPLGISFYTFQTVSYSIDVYRGIREPEKNFILFACYAVYFPQLVAGPILRAGEVIDQLDERPPFRPDDISTGIRRIAFGLMLKVVLADNIAPLVDSGFAVPAGSLSALDVWTLAFLFGFQIYFDLSAYSHIAIGSARLMGISFPENFNFPYIASSPKDFWRRWHISLSSWVRDYLYLPLAGVPVANRSSSEGGLAPVIDERQKTRALFASWALMGLWHGANWTFVLWGVYHSVLVYFHRLWERRDVPLPAWIGAVAAPAITVPVMMLGWIPFRSATVTDAVVMWGKVLDPRAYFALGLRENVYLVTALLTAGFLSVYLVYRKLSDTDWTVRTRFVPELAMYTVIFCFLIIFLRPVNQFIYFQF